MAFYMVLYRMIRGPYRITLDPPRSYTILFAGISEIVGPYTIPQNLIEFYIVICRMICGPYKITLDPIKSYTIPHLEISETVGPYIIQ